MSTFETKRISDFRLRGHLKRAQMVWVGPNDYCASIVSVEDAKLLDTHMIYAPSHTAARRLLMVWLDENYPDEPAEAEAAGSEGQ